MNDADLAAIIGEHLTAWMARTSKKKYRWSKNPVGRAIRAALQNHWRRVGRWKGAAGFAASPAAQHRAAEVSRVSQRMEAESLSGGGVEPMPAGGSSEPDAETWEDGTPMSEASRRKMEREGRRPGRKRPPAV